MPLAFSNPNHISVEQLSDKVNQHLKNAKNDTEPDTAYKQMNALRDWFNEQFKTFDLYLEDVWNENTDGETHFEYILRSLHTLDETPVLAFDVYSNRQDTKGVWHLGDYSHTVINIKNADLIVEFMQHHGAQW